MDLHLILGGVINTDAETNLQTPLHSLADAWRPNSYLKQLLGPISSSFLRE